jgi:hypothetical protein
MRKLPMFKYGIHGIDYQPAHAHGEEEEGLMRVFDSGRVRCLLVKSEW